MWKQALGKEATYSNLIGVFERANHQGYADTVRRIIEEMSSELTDDSGGDEIFPGSTPSSSSPTLPLLPVFPAPNVYTTYTGGSTHFTPDQTVRNSSDTPLLSQLTGSDRHPGVTVSACITVVTLSTISSNQSSFG